MPIQSNRLTEERTTALETRLQQHPIEELLSGSLGYLDKIPAREVPEWDRIK